MSLGCSWCSESLGAGFGAALPFLFRPAEHPAQCPARDRVKRGYLRRRTVAFSSLFNFALPTPSLAQSRGATRVPCSRVTWYRAMYGPVCHLFFFCALYLFYFVFPAEYFPPRGAVSGATFHAGCLWFRRQTPRHADGRREVFRMTFPLS